MARAGRKRTVGVSREANGRAKREIHVNPRLQVASQPHRCEVAIFLRERDEAGTRFGRMMLNGRITFAQYQAGNEYARLVEDNRRASFAPSANPPAMGFEGGSRGHSAGMPDEVSKNAVRRFTGAFNAIQFAGWQIAVMHFAVHDNPIADELDFKRLACGLDRLVDHLGIDPKLQITLRQ